MSFEKFVRRARPSLAAVHCRAEDVQILLSSCMSACVAERVGTQPLQTVQSIDLQRYLGRWYVFMLTG
jgi:lipocalin